jgi:hypothetical protein
MIVAQAKPISFRCPITWKLVEHSIVDEPSDRPRDRFEAVHCPACGLTHMVDWLNGKTIEQED